MFVEEYLEELRRERFTPLALIRYLRRTAGRTRDHIIANPGAVRSIWSVALGFFTAAFLVSSAMAVVYDRSLAYAFFLNTALWVLVSFTFVTCYVDGLRDRDGYPLSAINAALVFTLLRVSLVPGILLFLRRGHFALALAAFVIAAVTDIADGWIARRWNQVTRMGTVLDPLVDIVFNFAMFAGLVMAGLLPWWVFALAALRYGVLIAGGIWLYLFVGPVKIRPTSFGRFSGVLLSALVGFLVLLHVRSTPLAGPLIPLTRIAIGVLIGSTVAHVVALGWYNVKVMTGQAQAPGSVVGDVRWGAR